MINVKSFLISLVTPKYRAQGIDGAFWWGWFKPEQATKPIDFIIVKATQGKSIIDPAFDENSKAAMKIPVRGAYHYQKQGDSWVLQADLFLRIAARYDFHIYGLDVEKYANEGAFASQAATDTFVSDMRRILDHWRAKAPAKVQVVLYTNQDLYQNYIVPALKRLYGLEGEQWAEEQLLWLAVYNGQGPDGNPTMPKNRKNPWTFWQYSSNGRKQDYGTNGDVDLNVYNGTVEQLHKQFLDGIVVDPTPPPVVVPDPVEEPATEPETWTGTVITWRDPLIVRSYPMRVSETDTKLRLATGSRVSGKLWAGNGYVWMKLGAMTLGDGYTGKWVAVRTVHFGDKFIRLDEQTQLPPPPVVVPAGLVSVVWDDQNPDYNFMSRTKQLGWRGTETQNPPAVYRFYPEMREKSGDYRVNLADPFDWKPSLIRVNGGDAQKFRYLTTAGVAQYNQTGWPMQAYLTMSGNKLAGEVVGQWFGFETLKPGDLGKVGGMTIVTHPHLIHRFTCVTWDPRTRTTERINSSGTPRGDVFYYLVTKEGIAYIPLRHVIG